MQIDLKAAEGEIGIKWIIELSLQIQLINRETKTAAVGTGRKISISSIFGTELG